MDEKRLFFAVEVSAPWPKELPEGRLVPESSRHLTLAFLGNIPFSSLRQALPSLPLPQFKVGLVGRCDEVLFLPKATPRVVACHVKWLAQEELLLSFQRELIRWLKIEDQRFLSHVTVARAPFIREEWKNAPLHIPFAMKAIHLYESLGGLHYKPLWSYPLISPFEEEEHTADIAFLIRAHTPQQLHLNAQIALAFKFPALLSYVIKDPLCDSLDDMIIQLNQMIAQADQEEGCPFKAVSFHGRILEDEKQILNWKMIVDV